MNLEHEQQDAYAGTYFYITYNGCTKNSLLKFEF
jgi:hypothetical protein